MQYGGRLVLNRHDHVAHKAEHAVDLETGAIVAVTLQGADRGDTTTLLTTLPDAVADLEAVAAVADDVVRTGNELVARTPSSMGRR